MKVRKTKDVINKLLEKAEASELMEFVRQQARKNMAFGADYVNYAKLLKRFSNLPGAAPLVAELLTHIRATSPRRRALLEVLSAL